MSQYTPKGRAWWVLAAIVKAEEPNCGICGRWIDHSLPKEHPAAYQCDHIISPRLRPDLALERSNLRASHRRCNNDRNRRHPPVSQLHLTVTDF